MNAACASIWVCLFELLSPVLNCSVVILFLQVREQGSQKGEASPYLSELLQLEERAKQEGVGRWSTVVLSFPVYHMRNFPKVCN